MAKRTLAWPADRLEDLDLLRELLRECESINSGNNVLSRLDQIIKLAGRLNNWQDSRRRRSFVSFLEELAMPEETVNGLAGG
jgi:hypothetical protein